MGWISDLRVAAQLRRVAKALEASNDLARERLSLDHPEWGRTAGLRRVSKLVEVGVASVEDWNERWRADHPEAET